MSENSLLLSNNSTVLLPLATLMTLAWILRLFPL
nr:MAG TPA: hypothetical protein [Caudoviricetes sp.]